MKIAAFLIFTVAVTATSDLSKLGLTKDTQARIAQAQEIYGSAFTITSAHRTEEHNRDVGGVTNSYHLKGEAVDILKPKNVFQTHKLIWALTLVGFTNFGIYKNHIHVDMAEKKRFWIG